MAIKFTGVGAWQTKANAAIDKLVKETIEDADVHENRPPSPDESYFVDLHVSLSFASPRLLSVHAEFGDYRGQPHPQSGSTNINLEIPTGRELRLDDLLTATKANEIFHYCRSQVAKEKLERWADTPGVDKTDDVDLKEVEESTREFSIWQFRASDVDIYYGAYGFGGYGQCMCTCTVPYSTLRPIANKDFPLP